MIAASLRTTVRAAGTVAESLRSMARLYARTRRANRRAASADSAGRFRLQSRHGGGMRNFLAELRRRNVDRAAAFYAAAGWLLVQVATQVFPFFDLPNWSVRLVIVAALVGFPFLLLFSWF